jgi:hypothetical protein
MTSDFKWEAKPRKNRDKFTFRHHAEEEEDAVGVGKKQTKTFSIRNSFHFGLPNQRDSISTLNW